MKDKQSTETLLYKSTQYIYYFFITNVYFLLSNSVFLIVLLFLPISISNLLIYTVALLPTGASLTATFYTMGKLYREKTINPTSNYWGAYRKNFIQSTKYSLILLFVILVLIVDILYVLNNGWAIITAISMFLLLLVILSGIYAFSILARFEVSIKNLLIFSIILMYQNKWNSLSLLSLLLAFLIILYGFAHYAILVFFSLISYYFMRKNDPILKKIKKEYIDSKGEGE